MTNKTIRYALIAAFALFAVALIWTIVAIIRKDDTKKADTNESTSKTTLVAQPVTDTASPKTDATSEPTATPAPATKKTVTTYYTYTESVSSNSSASASASTDSASASASASAR